MKLYADDPEVQEDIINFNVKNYKFIKCSIGLWDSTLVVITPYPQDFSCKYLSDLMDNVINQIIELMEVPILMFKLFMIKLSCKKWVVSMLPDSLQSTATNIPTWRKSSRTSYYVMVVKTISWLNSHLKIAIWNGWKLLLSTGEVEHPTHISIIWKEPVWVCHLMTLLEPKVYFQIQISKGVSF